MATKQTNQKNKRRGGLYWLPGEERPFLTVTRVLSIVAKPSLLFWACGITYDAMVVNPSIERKEAISEPQRQSKKAMARGTTIHDVVEAYKNGAPRISSIPEFQGYIDSFYRWVDDNSVELVDQEKTVVSREHWYAGTFDMKAKLAHRNDIWLVDVKTGKAIYPETQLQLSAYKQAAEEMGEHIDRMGVLLLGADGTYKFEEKAFLLEPFLAAKELYEWQSREQLQKYGYFSLS